MKYLDETGMYVGNIPSPVTGSLCRRYRKPVLERLGDLRSMTLGGSPGNGDSGGTYTSRYPIISGGSFPILPLLPEEYQSPDDPYIPPN